jgi:hypothetical protein
VSTPRASHAPTIGKPLLRARSTPRRTPAAVISVGNIRFTPSGPSIQVIGPSVHTEPPQVSARNRNQLV